MRTAASTNRGLRAFLPALVLLACVAGFAAAQQKGAFKLPEYEKFKLDNGLTVYLMEHHEVPLVYVSAIFSAGAIHDGDNNGLAYLTAEGLLFGAENYSKEEIEEAFDFYGASINTGADLESAGLFACFAVKDMGELLPMLKEVITKPNFDATEFDKRKSRLLLELARGKESPGRVIGTYFNKFFYAEHPYGNPVSGTGPAVEKIGAEDLKRFYGERYGPAGSAIAVVGDFRTEEMKRTVADLLADWKVGVSQPEQAELPPMPGHDKARLLLVNKDDSMETRFIIGGPGIEQSNPDYVPVQVINTILGGRFTSWLNDELRVNAGLTYGARSAFATYRDGGTFVAASFTRTETTVRAIDLALEVLDRLHTRGVDAATLDSAKNYIKGQFPPDFETAGALARLLTSMYFYGYDEAFINGFQAAVDGLTVEKANEIIAKYFPRGNFQFVLIGKASAIRDQVAKYGEMTEKEITAEGF